MNRRRHLVTLLVVGFVSVVSACGGADGDPVFATASVSLSRTQAALGSPVEMTYAFAVAQPPPPGADEHRVFVHFLDADGEQMWADDHAPVPPVSSWAPGQRITYTRTIFLPIYPYVGEAAVVVGLYDVKTGERLRLGGTDNGQRSYQVATLQVLPQTENIFLIFKDGWHQPEVSPDNAQAQWQWTRGEGTLTFRNPKRDLRLSLHIDGRPPGLPEPQTVTVKVAGQPVDTVRLEQSGEVLRRVPLTAAQLGDGDTVELRIGVDRTFVPATLPGGSSADHRELGVRVFHVFVEPR